MRCTKKFQAYSSIFAIVCSSENGQPSIATGTPAVFTLSVRGTATILPRRARAVPAQLSR